MKVLLLSYLADRHSGLYIAESLRDLKHKCTAIDIRQIVFHMGTGPAQAKILEEVDNIEETPELIIVCKGLEMTYNTIKTIKDKFPGVPIVNWFFDWYLSGIPIWDNESYADTLNLYDHYFCSVKGVADNLRAVGFKQAKYLDQGCQPNYNGETFLNYYQEEQYGSDVSFAGSLGYFKIHPQRLQYLQRVIDAGFDIKIWGDVVGAPGADPAAKWRRIPFGIRAVHTQNKVINDAHSKVCQASKINLGIDSNILLDHGWSVRLFKVLCAGGLYLTNNTKGLSDFFNINKEGEPITFEQDLAVYYNEEDLIDKIDFLLEHDFIRERIAKNGQRKVLEKHKYLDRVKEMLKVIKNEN